MGSLVENGAPTAGSVLGFGMAVPSKVSVGCSMVHAHEAWLALSGCNSTKLGWWLTAIEMVQDLQGWHEDG